MTDVIKIDRIPAETILVPILGTTPLIVHRFDEKAKRMMLDREQGRKAVKTIRDPKADYEASMYRTDTGGYGFPSVGFKSATVAAARFYDKSVTMVGLRQALFFHGVYSKSAGQNLVEIVGEPIMREDYVRFGQGSTDLRYRAEFTEWSAVLRITYVTSSLARSSVLSLVDAGGMGVGVGEWRPLSKQSSGEFGTYTLDPSREVEMVS